jgi:hypothetical protein
VDYRDVLATVVGASVAGIIAFALRLIFPINAAVLALVYAATYALLWTIVGDHAKLLFHRYLPASTRLGGHWRLVTGSIALLAAACAGLIVAFALSRPSLAGSSTQVPMLLTRTVKLQPRVIVNKRTIVLPVRTMIVSTPIEARAGRTTTIYSRTVVEQRPPITVTVSSTQAARTATITQTTTVSSTTTTPPSVTSPVAETPLQPGTDTVPAAPTDTVPAP